MVRDNLRFAESTVSVERVPYRAGRLQQPTLETDCYGWALRDLTMPVDTNMISHWTIWTDSKREQSSVVQLQKVAALMGRTPIRHGLIAYPKTGGHKVSFDVALEATRWNDAVVECIDLGQRVARDWGLTGSVLEDAGASSTSTSVSGVAMIEWGLRKGDPRD